MIALGKGDPTVPGRIMITSGVQELAAENAAGNLEPVLNEVRIFRCVQWRQRSAR